MDFAGIVVHVALVTSRPAPQASGATRRSAFVYAQLGQYHPRCAGYTPLSATAGVPALTRGRLISVASNSD